MAIIKVTIGNNISRNAVLIDSATTLRAALENAGVDYTMGMTTLDGSTLQAGDLDRTFDDFGIAEKCYLLNIVKADNAVEAKVLGGALVLTSGVPYAKLEMLAKYRPDALTLYKGEGKEKEADFIVMVDKKGYGSINKFGAAFGKIGSKNGEGVITVQVPEGTEDPKKWAEEYLGVAILKLQRVEAQFAGAIADVEAEKAAVAAAITMA